MRFIAVMTFFAISALAGIMVVDRAASGDSLASKLRNFHHWTVVSHWTNPAGRQVTVLLDETAVEGGDATCDAVLSMLEKLTAIIPATWTVKMISPTGWIPARWNPIDRQGVLWMIDYEPYKGMEADARWEAWKEENGIADSRETEEWQRPPPSHMFIHRTQTSH